MWGKQYTHYPLPWKIITSEENRIPACLKATRNATMLFPTHISLFGVLNNSACRPYVPEPQLIAGTSPRNLSPPALGGLLWSLRLIAGVPLLNVRGIITLFN